MNINRATTLSLSAIILTLGVLTAAYGFADVGRDEYRLVGNGSFSKWGIPVYDASLKAPNGVYAADKPFSLSLTYKLGLKGGKIAEQAVKEISRQNVDKAQLAVWQKELMGLIPDVKSGDSLTGVRQVDGTMILLKNGQFVGSVKDKALTDAFFGIWLGSATSDPVQRSRLLSKS